MAYTPKTWQCGETIMADDLNHMEQGIAQGSAEPLIIHFTGESRTEGRHTYYATDATYNDVVNAITSGKAVYLYTDNNSPTLTFYPGTAYFGIISAAYRERYRAEETYGVETRDSDIFLDALTVDAPLEYTVSGAA
mgnify:CR=1 FL=1